MIDYSEFLARKQEGFTHIPLVSQVLADLDTPLSLYLKLANKPHSFLLESVEGGERFGRYSFIGLPCRDRIEIRGDEVSYWRDGACQSRQHTDPIAYIRAFQAAFHTPAIADLPRFTGGLVGYFGYETVHYFEPSRLGKKTQRDDLGVPDILLMVCTELAVVDNLSGKIYLIAHANAAEENAYQAARARLEELRTALRQAVATPLSLGSAKTQPHCDVPAEEYKHYVKVIRDYIEAGDCMQVVPSQRLSMPFHDSPLSLYRALRTLNPSPYLFYYDLGDFHIVGSSPEILVRRENDSVIVRPLAGTRLRGKTPAEDEALAQELLSDPKEIAEHVMLIDLGRNDVGRISQTGQVRVTDKMVIEKYSHVMHIVSNVEGALKAGVDNMDVLRATFPAGTLSGAPKIRAMQIIEELEPAKRGIYSGAVGYLGFNGDMDVAIAIRTAVIKDNMLYAQSGAGIVADSDPESEWQETQNKARALIRAAQMVQEGLDN